VTTARVNVMTRGIAALFGGLIFGFGVVLLSFACIITGFQYWVWFVAPFVTTFIAGVALGGAKPRETELLALGGFFLSITIGVLIYEYMYLPLETDIIKNAYGYTIAACFLALIGLIAIERSG